MYCRYVMWFALIWPLGQYRLRKKWAELCQRKQVHVQTHHWRKVVSNYYITLYESLPLTFSSIKPVFLCCYKGVRSNKSKLANLYIFHFLQVFLLLFFFVLHQQNMLEQQTKISSCSSRFLSISASFLISSGRSRKEIGFPWKSCIWLQPGYNMRYFSWTSISFMTILKTSLKSHATHILQYIWNPLAGI